jgi:hypothetical protein
VTTKTFDVMRAGDRLVIASHNPGKGNDLRGECGDQSGRRGACDGASGFGR